MRMGVEVVEVAVMRRCPLVIDAQGVGAGDGAPATPLWIAVVRVDNAESGGSRAWVMPRRAWRWKRVCDCPTQIDQITGYEGP